MPLTKLNSASVIERLPVGSVLQTVQTSFTNTATYSGTAFQTITDLNTTITPTSSSSKILIMVNISQGESQDAFPAYLLKRGNTTVQIADTYSGSPIEATFFGVRTGNDVRDQYLQAPVNYQFLDSPNTTNATIYSVQVSPMRVSSKTIVINQMTTMGDANQGRGCSTMILMEIKG